MSNNLLDENQSVVLTTNSVISNSVPASELSFYSHAGTSIGLSFIGIISIILLFGWLVKRLGWKHNASSLIDIKANYIINQKERIVLIHVDQQLLLVGVTPQQMTLLHTISGERTQLLLSRLANEHGALKKNLFQQILQSTLKNNKE